MIEPLYPCLEEALAAKGIGPKGLKPLAADVLEGVVSEMRQGAPEPLVAAFLMGFQVLEKNEIERACLLGAFDRIETTCSPSLAFLFKPLSHIPKIDAEFWIQVLVRGEELSKEACGELIPYLLDEAADDVYKVALLQGLRVKRETECENEYLLKALSDIAPRQHVNLDQLVDLSFPYDGMTRNDDISLELVGLLSLMGQPCVIHSVKNLGPKYGSVILDKISPEVICDANRALLGLQHCGVAILDQAHVFPALHQLLPLRNAMKKRPFLATMEKMLQPLRAKRNIIVTGYVHSAYRESIPEMLHRVGFYEKVMLVKGLEGSVVLEPTKKQSLFWGNSVDNQEYSLPRWEVPVLTNNFNEDLWWRNSTHRKTQSLLFTAGTILKYVLGDISFDAIVHAMQEKLNDGLLEDQLESINAVYPILKVK